MLNTKILPLLRCCSMIRSGKSQTYPNGAGGLDVRPLYFSLCCLHVSSPSIFDPLCIPPFLARLLLSLMLTASCCLRLSCVCVCVCSRLLACSCARMLSLSLSLSLSFSLFVVGRPGDVKFHITCAPGRGEGRQRRFAAGINSPEPRS